MTRGDIFWWGCGLLGAAAGVSWAVNRGLLGAGRLLTIDAPNSRSLHERPVPRGGGLGILAAVLLLAGPVLLALGERALLASLLGPLAVVGLVSYLDDRRSLPPWPRIAVHVAAAVWFLVGVGGLERLALPEVELRLGPVGGAVLTTLLVVWLTNLYNFMDGMDGFAAGMALIGFATLAALAALADDAAGAALAATAAGAAGGFLGLNYPPARLFMGDVGASSLGFLAGALIVRADHAGELPAWVGLLVFAPFVVDASVTLMRRAARGERVWQAHRTHYYQRLVRLGWGHRRTVLIEYALMLACALSALLAVRLPPGGQWVVIGGWGLGFVVLMGVVGRLERGLRAGKEGMRS